MWHGLFLFIANQNLATTLHLIRKLCVPLSYDIPKQF